MKIKNKKWSIQAVFATVHPSTVCQNSAKTALKTHFFVLFCTILGCFQVYFARHMTLGLVLSLIFIAIVCQKT